MSKWTIKSDGTAAGTVVFAGNQQLKIRKFTLYVNVKTGTFTVNFKEEKEGDDGKH